VPTYEYECRACGKGFERRQPITEAPLDECPSCHGELRRLVSGGSGFIVRGGRDGQVGYRGSECSLEQEGRTCCGRGEHCGKPPCGGVG
jgi:putative FmdB family regulatory protein